MLNGDVNAAVFFAYRRCCVAVFGAVVGAVGVCFRFENRSNLSWYRVSSVLLQLMQTPSVVHRNSVLRELVYLVSHGFPLSTRNV